MISFVTIASLSIKAVNTYFNQQNNEKLGQIIDQNKKVVDYLVRQSTNAKTQLLARAQMELKDGINTSNLKSGEEYLNLAYNHYTELTNLPLVEELADGSYHNNENFICQGIYGRFLYFGLKQDIKNATIQVYTCAYLFPHQAINLFDNSFFPTLDYSELSELCVNLDLARHHKPLKGIYSNIPSNMAEALLEMQVDRYKSNFKSILETLKNDKYEQI